VLGVRGYQRQVVPFGNRRNLTIDEGNYLAFLFESGSLIAAPEGSRLIVAKDGEVGLHDASQVVIDGGAALALGKKLTALNQLVRNRGTRCAAKEPDITIFLWYDATRSSL